MAIDQPLYIVMFVEGEYGKLIKDIAIPSIIKVDPTIDPSRHIFLLHGSVSIPEHLDEESARFDWAGMTDYRPYKELMRLRIKRYEEALQILPPDSKVLFLDCDVIATAPFKQEILDYLDHYDFVMQSNYIAGIWGVKNNNRTLAFFKRFREIIDNIEPQDRQDGYPQFELGETLTTSIEEKKLSVLELPPSYGYLRLDNRIYHAINGGFSVDAKAITLFAAAMLIGEMRANNWKRWDPWELEILKDRHSKHNLTYVAAFYEADVSKINEIIATDDGGADWSQLPNDYQVEPYSIIHNLLQNDQKICIANNMDFTPEDQNPRFASILTKETWTGWIDNLNS